MKPSAIKRHDGAWIVFDIIAGYLVTRVYMGYTRRDAIRLFIQLNKGSK